MDKSTTNVTKRMQAYAKLPSIHQRILHIKAILYKTYRNKTNFYYCIQRSSLRTAQNKKLTRAELDAILRKLRHLDLLDRDLDCVPLIVHRVTQDALAVTNSHAAANLETVKNFAGFRATPDLASDRLDYDDLRAIHIAVHINDSSLFTTHKTHDSLREQLLLNALHALFDEEVVDMAWLKSRAPQIQAYLALTKLSIYYQEIFLPPPDLDAWLVFYRNAPDLKLSGYLLYLKTQIDISLGLLDDAKQALPKLVTTDRHYELATAGTLLFLDGNSAEASTTYAVALKAFKKHYAKRNWFMDDMHGVFYLLLLIVQNHPEQALKQARLACRQSIDHKAIFSALEALALAQIPGRYDDAILEFTEAHAYSHYDPLHLYYVLIETINYWLDGKTSNPAKIKQYRHYFQQTQTMHPLSAHLYAELLCALDKGPSVAVNFLKQSPLPDLRLLNLFKTKQSWEYNLDKLTTLISNQTAKTGSGTAPVKKGRLVWLLDPESLEISILEQTFGKKGHWSKGRAIALKRLYDHDNRLDFLTEQDWHAATGIEKEYVGWYNESNYYWNISQTIPALIGHPLVFHHANPEVHLELIKAELELYIETKEDGYLFTLSHVSEQAGIILEPESQHRYRVIEISPKAAEMSKLITANGLKVPETAKEVVLQLIQSPETNICISADLEGVALPTVEGDSTPCLQLLPVKEGLKINTWVRPFSTQGPYYRAGHGKAHVIAQIQTDAGEQRYKATRDLAAEEKQLAHLLGQSPTLAQANSNTDEWYFDEPAACLEVLAELDAYQHEHPVRMEWPKGQTFQLKKTLTSKDMRLSITSNQQWFEYEGEIALDDDRVLQMQTLLGLLDHSQGRFIEVGSGQFIALTEQFKKQLEELRAMSEGNRVYHLSSASLRELAEDIDDVSYDDQWEKHLKKIRAMEKHNPTVPSTLQAELRDYQTDGFKYVSRLAHWGIGACLADDMGLGKTIQAIAFLLEQTHKGPSIVIAPTSVCFNWCEEIAKFASTLNAHLMPAQDREAYIKKLGKMDVLICSYGLLVQTDAALLAKSWQVVILDEAQAIKNNNTKRWQAATALQGACRLALTGTPIENHLGELWSIFRFLNPGLLSSLKNFQARYAIPIEKQQDRIARRSLKKVVQPYILRRLKSAVLDELPPKTEQTIVVEPTQEELAFYEALRKNALKRIASTQETKSGSKRFAILAEIMRLRQACCHCSLVNDGIQLASSKIKTFLALIETLRENHHKALVFSQFVRYLAVIKKHLDQENISYQYLDGQTPAKQRKQAVNDFQSGKSDLFLLSLKAGGTGLNLTAADYVIHLDPWWNPAVEDQASDRAHRIGQTRPVTIYRLIMQNTIEQKIIDLHGHKRDLASDLLSDGDVSGKITEEELVKLIEV